MIKVNGEHVELNGTGSDIAGEFNAVIHVLTHETGGLTQEMCKFIVCYYSKDFENEEPNEKFAYLLDKFIEEKKKEEKGEKNGN